MIPESPLSGPSVDGRLAALVVGRRVRLEPAAAYQPYVQSLLGDPATAYRLMLGRAGTSPSDILALLTASGLAVQFVVVHSATGRPVGWVAARHLDYIEGTCHVLCAMEQSIELRVWPLEGLWLFLNVLKSELRVSKVYFECPAYIERQVLDTYKRAGAALEAIRPSAIWAFGQLWDRLTFGLDLPARPWLRGSDRTAARLDQVKQAAPDRPRLTGRRSVLRAISKDDLTSLWHLFHSEEGLWYRTRGTPVSTLDFEAFVWSQVLVQFGVASVDDPDRFRGLLMAYGHDPYARTAYVGAFFDRSDGATSHLLDSGELFFDYLFQNFKLDQLFFEVSEHSSAPIAGLDTLYEHVGDVIGPAASGAQHRMSLYVLTSERWHDRASTRTLLRQARATSGAHTPGPVAS